MESTFLKKALKVIPLKTRLEIAIQFAFVDLLTELGYRKNKAWTSNEDDNWDKLSKLSKDFTTDLLKEIKEWEQDGKP